MVLVASIVVARFFGKTVYGELGMVRSTISTFGVFAGLGLGMTATKYVAQYYRIDPARAGRIIGLAELSALGAASLMAVGVFAFAPWLAANTINAAHLSGVLRVGALVLLFDAISGAQTGALAGFEAFRAIARVNFFVGAISFPLLVLGAWAGGLSGAVWALVVNLCFQSLLNHIALRAEARRHNVSISLGGWAQELPVLWGFSLPAVLSGVMVGPVNWICGAILVNKPGGYGEMGLYNAANQWYSAFLFIPMVIGSVVLPVLSEQLGRKDAARPMRTILLAMKMNAAIVIPMVISVSMASRYVMGLYGACFSAGWPTLVVALGTASLVAIQSPVGQAIAASGRMWLGFAMNAGWAIAFVISSLLLVRFGALGLAWARAISYFFHSVWSFGFAVWLLRKK